MFFTPKMFRDNIFIIGLTSVEISNDYNFSMTKFVKVLLVFLICAHAHIL
jgi:hypothetical protein